MTFIIPKGLGLICLISSSSTPPSCCLNSKCQYVAQRWGEYRSARQYRSAHPSFCLSWEGDPSLLPMRGRTSRGVNEGTASRRHRHNANCHLKQLMASEGGRTLSESASETSLSRRRRLMIPLKRWNKAEATGPYRNGAVLALASSERLLLTTAEHGGSEPSSRQAAYMLIPVESEWRRTAPSGRFSAAHKL